jgi:hypothetical protein
MHPDPDLFSSLTFKTPRNIYFFKKVLQETDVYHHHGARPISIICHLPTPPLVSLSITLSIYVPWPFCLPRHLYLPLKNIQKGEAHRTIRRALPIVKLIAY